MNWGTASAKSDCIQQDPAARRRDRQALIIRGPNKLRDRSVVLGDRNGAVLGAWFPKDHLAVLSPRREQFPLALIRQAADIVLVRFELNRLSIRGAGARTIPDARD